MMTARHYVSPNADKTWNGDGIVKKVLMQNFL